MISPLDLQTMYSQIDKVAKQASFMQQGVQLSEAMQQVNVVRQNTEQAQKVHSSDESANSSSVNENGSGENQENQKSKKQNEKNSELEEPVKKRPLTESYLGNHIDITR